MGEDALEKGISVKISAWNRAAPNTFPMMAKITGNYVNSQLVKIDALQDGYDEGIALDRYGYVSEGSGENVFIVRNGIIFTPPSSSGIFRFQARTRRRSELMTLHSPSLHRARPMLLKV